MKLQDMLTPAPNAVNEKRNEQLAKLRVPRAAYHIGLSSRGTCETRAEVSQLRRTMGLEAVDALVLRNPAPMGGLGLTSRETRLDAVRLKSRNFFLCFKNSIIAQPAKKTPTTPIAIAKLNITICNSSEAVARLSASSKLTERQPARVLLASPVNTDRTPDAKKVQVLLGDLVHDHMAG